MDGCGGRKCSRYKFRTFGLSSDRGISLTGLCINRGQGRRTMGEEQDDRPEDNSNSSSVGDSFLLSSSSRDSGDTFVGAVVVVADESDTDGDCLKVSADWHGVGCGGGSLFFVGEAFFLGLSSSTSPDDGSRFRRRNSGAPSRSA
mmetsp:Transcript_4290/g.6365  ORF Transcript_4290/g.6365 Transcript_4290/m.6365 type:complete len:145 (-) Transcript_4290:241-675(-)